MSSNTSNAKLYETLETIRSQRFSEISADLLRAILDLETEYPSQSERDIAQRELETLIEKSIRD